MLSVLRLLWTAAVLVSLSLTTAGAQNEPAVGGWRFEKMETLGELLQTDAELRNPVLSLDGSAVAWDSSDALCVHRFGGDTACASWFDGGIRSRQYNLPYLSPDGATLAFHEDLIYAYMDSDLWTLDVPSGTFTNHTDDGYEGRGLGDEVDSPLDYLPSWNPADSRLYFFHAEADEAAVRTLELYRLPALDAAPELVRDFTADQPEPLSVYVPVAWSPDGRRLALLMLPRNAMANPLSGLYIYDLETDALTQAASLQAIHTAAVPEWAGVYLPQSIFWAGDLLLLNLTPTEFPVAPFLAALIDPADGTITPVVNLRGVDRETLYATDDSRRTPLFAAPYVSAPSPDGRVLWYVSVNPFSRENGLWALPLPLGSGEPVLLHTFTGFPRPGFDLYPTVSADGKLLIHDLLFTFSAG